MEEKAKTYLSTEQLKTFYIFAGVVITGCSLYFGLSAKIDSNRLSLGSEIAALTLAVRDQTEVTKTLTTTVNRHETRIALVEEKANACYSYCLAPGRVSQSSNQNKDQVASATHSGQTNVSVRSESKSESKESPRQETPQEEEEDNLIEVDLPGELPDIKVQKFKIGG